MRIFLFFVVLAASVLVGLAIARDPGYLLIVYREWSVEMPLWLGVVTTLLGIYITFLFFRLLAQIVHAPGETRRWFRHKRLSRIRRRTVRGYIAFAEGHWKEAERLLVKSSHKLHTALINYLCAATAAQKLGKIATRDEYLRLAHQTDSRADLAIGITQARLQCESGQLEQGLATLQRLHQMSPKHDYILELLYPVLVQLKDWQGLIEILPDLKHAHFIDHNKWSALAKQAYLGLLEHAHNDEAKKAVWERIPNEWRLDADLLAVYVPILIKEGHMIDAEALLKTSLKGDWDPRLVRLYGRVQIPDIDRQIKTAETWLKRHYDDPMLLLCLGRFYAAKGIWGQAQELLKNSLSIQVDAETYFVLGHVYENRGDAAQALASYEAGLKQSLEV